MITDVNESKTLAKHILYKFKSNFGGRNYNSDELWNNDKC